MIKNVVLTLAILFGFSSFAESAKTTEITELKIACKVAAAGMPNGNGATVYFSNGRHLTTSAGRVGATWYYPNGRHLTTSMGTPGATFYYSNGRHFSTSTGTAGATWYYPNGRHITTSGPALTPAEMVDLACDLLIQSLGAP